jgi:hypothetical protein
MNLTLPILSPPSPIKLTYEQIEIKREEIKKILKEPIDENNISINSSESNNKKISSSQSTPFSSGTIVTPISRLSFTK